MGVDGLTLEVNRVQEPLDMLLRRGDLENRKGRDWPLRGEHFCQYEKGQRERVMKTQVDLQGFFFFGRKLRAI